MRDIFIRDLNKVPQAMKLHCLREKLQHLILKIIDEKGYFSQLLFVGGTALRILFNMKRFSEDLDFSLDLTQKKRFDFNQCIKIVKERLSIYGFETELKKKTKGTVNNCFIKFPTLLHEISPHFRSNQKLSIRLDIDTNPPPGFHVETSAIEKDFLLKIRHYDKPSLFAGKLHAILCRSYLKGRDLYDFIWFCANHVPVNIELLNNAYQQTQKKPPPWSKTTFHEILSRYLSKIDYEKAFLDASSFMEDLNEKRFFDKSLFLSMAERIELVD